MAKVTTPGGPQFMSRALRPGVQEGPSAGNAKSPAFDLGSLKGPKTTGPMGPAKIGKGIKPNKGMKPPSFGGRPSPRGK